MNFSVGVEYALHCLLYMVEIPSGKSVGIKDLAQFQGVSETYLSKVFTKLKKNGIVNSVPGVNGGYALARPADEISFWDVVEAVEGKDSFFKCNEIRQKEILLDPKDIPESFTLSPCLIKVVMNEAEEQMRNHLRSKSLAWLRSSVDAKIPESYRQSTIDWFNKKRVE